VAPLANGRTKESRLQTDKNVRNVSSAQSNGYMAAVDHKNPVTERTKTIIKQSQIKYLYLYAYSSTDTTNINSFFVITHLIIDYNRHQKSYFKSTKLVRGYKHVIQLERQQLT
jgi:hypothetical protein